ncbi:acyltransferase family protein, partial [Nostoc sp. NIES-2111]
MLRLDALRLIAALGVVVFHFNRYLDLDGRWDAVNHTVRAFNLFVDLFFVVSGYVISSVYATRITSLGAYGDFLLKRVARLGPLHWATLAFYVVLAVLAYA